MPNGWYAQCGERICIRYTEQRTRCCPYMMEECDCPEMKEYNQIDHRRNTLIQRDSRQYIAKQSVNEPR